MSAIESPGSSSGCQLRAQRRIRTRQLGPETTPAMRSVEQTHLTAPPSSDGAQLCFQPFQELRDPAGLPPSDLGRRGRLRRCGAWRLPGDMRNSVRWFKAGGVGCRSTWPGLARARTSLREARNKHGRGVLIHRRESGEAIGKVPSPQPANQQAANVVTGARCRIAGGMDSTTAEKYVRAASGGGPRKPVWWRPRHFLGGTHRCGGAAASSVRCWGASSGSAAVADERRRGELESPPLRPNVRSAGFPKYSSFSLTVCCCIRTEQAPSTLSSPMCVSMLMRQLAPTLTRFPKTILSMSSFQSCNLCVQSLAPRATMEPSPIRSRSGSLITTLSR